MIIESFCEEDTFLIGKNIGKKAKKGEIYLLHGNLGVGKTVFTKGFAKGISIKEDITSPTFTILHEHGGGRLPFYHFDVYRIGDAEEMDELGYEDYFYGGGVCMIEWAEKIREILPDYCIEIRIEKDVKKGFHYRKLEIKKNEKNGGNNENTRN